MTYRHKKASCSKDAREILEKFAMQDGKYASVQFASAVNVKFEERSETGEESAEAENVCDEEIELDNDIQLPPMPVNETEVFEDYVPIQEVSFEVEETKEVVEKKRKKRNYVEFRDEHL